VSIVDPPKAHHLLENFPMREFAPLQHCPTCSGYVDCEHFVVDDLGDEAITYLYCEFCHRGIESLYYKVEGEWRRKVVINYDKSTRPELLKRFLENMEAARTVAA